MLEFSCDILHNILSRLPAKDLFRLKAVCKSWKRIIDDPFFVKSHIKNQQSYAASILIRNRYGVGGKLFSLSLDGLNYGAIRVKDIDLIPVKQLIHRGVPHLEDLPASSCNGLILITHQNIQKSWAIWNPLVQDFHEVPPPPPPVNDKYNFLIRTMERIRSVERISSGFGYDEASEDYKVVRVDRVYVNKSNDNVRVLQKSDLQLEIALLEGNQGFPWRHLLQSSWCLSQRSIALEITAWDNRAPPRKRRSSLGAGAAAAAT